MNTLGMMALFGLMVAACLTAQVIDEAIEYLWRKWRRRD